MQLEQSCDLCMDCFLCVKGTQRPPLLVTVLEHPLVYNDVLRPVTERCRVDSPSEERKFTHHHFKSSEFTHKQV